MRAAVEAATSVHIAGTLSDGSKQLTLDASLQGGGFSGYVSEGNKSFTLVLVAGHVYFKVDKTFLKETGYPAVDCNLVCGKYVEAPPSAVSPAVTRMNMSAFIKNWMSSIPATVLHDTSDRFTPATLNGQPVLKGVHGPDTFEVAATGTPYPLYLTETGQGSVTFSQWNAVPPITAPPASQIISPSNL